MQYSPSCDCCVNIDPGGCLVGGDNFDPVGTGTSPSAAWTEEVGNWEITNDGVSTADSNAILAFDTLIPLTGHQLVTVDVTATADGNQAQIHLGVGRSLVITLEVASDGCGVFGTGSHSIPARGLYPGETIAVTAYYDSITGVLWAKYVSSTVTRVIRGSAPIVAASTGTGTGSDDGYQTALGTGTVSSGSVSFDNFRVYKCPGLFDCDIHTVTDDAGDGCDLEVSGSPFYSTTGTGTTTDPWSITSLINGSAADEAELALSVTMVSLSPTGVVTLNLGANTATFTRLISPNRTTIALTGATSQTFSGHALQYNLSIAGGVSAANLAAGAVGAVYSVPSSGASASATGSDGEVASFSFSRCANMPFLVCAWCDPPSANAKSIAFGFFTTGGCSTCTNPPASIVVVGTGSSLPAPSIPGFPAQAFCLDYGGRTLLASCTWGPTEVLTGSNVNCNVRLTLFVMQFTNGDTALMVQQCLATDSAGFVRNIWIKFYSSAEAGTPCGPLQNEELPICRVGGGCIDFNNSVFVSSD